VVLQSTIRKRRGGKGSRQSGNANMPFSAVPQGTIRKRRGGQGEVALVLGAGNQAPVAPLDILHKLVAENAVVVCKMNPVNEYLGPFLKCAAITILVWFSST